MKVKKTKKLVNKETFFTKLKRFFSNEKMDKKIVFWAVLLSFGIWIFWGLPLPFNLASRQLPVSTKLYDRNGKLIYEIYADKRTTPVALNDIPKYAKEATISVEDKDFYKHYGISFTGTARAAYNIVFNRRLEGGSTLTQQLVKNELLTPERTIRRKLRELVLTLIVETFYSKDQILSMYLNEIPYGSTAYGIGAASELYFGKSAKDLDLAESSLLAGLVASPTLYSPFGAHPDLAKERQKIVLNRMVEDGYINKDEMQKALDEPLKYAAQNQPLQAPHFVLWIKEQLAQKYGDAVVEKGGLRVITTLDLDLQNFAQQAVATEVGKLKKQHVGNGSVLVTRPKTGEILAMVGSKDYFATDEDGKVNIAFAQRQPGSSIKPLNYALALRDGKITPSTPLADIPTCFLVEGQNPYCPVDYDRTFHGAVQARFALGNSYNVPAVRVLALNGLENFINFANTMGITTFGNPKNYGLSITLGGGEVTPYDMAVAYGVFANAGIKQPLISILKVSDWTGKVYEQIDTSKLEGQRVLNPDVTYLISHILLDNNARSAAFGDSSYLVVNGHSEVSVKTGTTNDRRDNWTIGYTPLAVVVTWVGNNDNSEMTGAVSGVSGASPIWNRVIKNVLDKAEKGYYDKSEKGHVWPEQPDNVVGATVCATTGNVPADPNNPGCPTRFEYFLKDFVGARIDSGSKDLQIDTSTNSIASPSATANVATQNHPYLVDALGSLVCLDCTLPNWQVNIGPLEITATPSATTAP